MNSNARPPRIPPTRSRALLAFAALMLGAAAVVTFSALRPGPDSSAAVLEVDDVVASSIPVTVPPRAPTPVATTPSTTRPAAEPTETTIPLSPLAALVGARGSAIPPEIERRLRPVRLSIDRIFVDDPVIEVGLEDDGELEVPGATEIGWYRYGAAPGYPGATVLAAHVTWNGEYGPFLNLGELEPGDRVGVELEDGFERIYAVVERTMYE